MESKAASFGSPTSFAGLNPGTSPPSRGRAWRAPWLVAGLLALVLAGDRGVFTATNNGVDPLDVLDLTVKNNVLFIVDTSGSMMLTGDADTYVGADDPTSRIYQAKQAVKQVVANQNGKINMGLLTYNSLIADHIVAPNTGLTYVSPDAVASDWDTLFNNPSTTFTNYDDTASSAEVFRSFASYSVINDDESGNSPSPYGTNGNGPFPQGCSYTSTSYDPVDFATPANTHCRRWIESHLYRDNAIIRWKRSSGNLGFISMSTITGGCPLPPAGLLGENDGTKAVPCFQLQDDATPTRIATFYYTGVSWHNNVGNNCLGAGRITNVSPCDDPTGALNTAVVTTINNAMAPGLPVQSGQLDIGGGLGAKVVLGSATGVLPGTKEFGGSTATNPPVFGLRPQQSTPLAGSLNDVRTANPAFFPARPAAAAGLQKNFVILITDGDDTCATGSTTDAKAVTAAKAAENLFYNTKASYTAEPSDPTHQAETMIVGFGKAVTPARVNVIGQGGSGASIDTTKGPTTAATCPTGRTCRNAFAAADTAGLVRVLNDAIAIAAATGRFSAAPSVVGTVFEYVNFVSTNSPLAPTQRYNFDVPVLFQSQFEMPGFKGHFKAFANPTVFQCTAAGGIVEVASDGSNTCLIWDAGQEILNRIILARAGTACTATQPDCMFPDDGIASDTAKTSDYTFAGLFGGATMASAGTANDLRIKRRIFTTSNNGVSPGRAALWPPDTSATGVDPGDPSPLAAGTRNPAGPFDAAFGLSTQTVTTLGTNFMACLGTFPSGHPCTSVVAADQLRAAVREAREVILAHLAGAEVSVTTNAAVPKRDSNGNLYYHARSWVLPESSLSTPAIMTPVPDKPTDNEKQEWTLYRDGPRDAGTKKSVNELTLGYGLRNPDRDGDVTSGNATSNLNIKPPMTLVLLGANDGLHAFRAGPCNATGATAATATFNTCNGVSYTEKGGDEAWSMVPFDQLGKLGSLVQAQTRATKTFVVSAGLRFGDIYVPGVFTDTGDGKAYNGRWKRALFFGRGIAGKHYTALDMTVTGPFTNASLTAPLPNVLWSRGNPDTTDGLPVTTCSGTCNNTTSAAQHDYDAYKKMGETWSVPALARVTVKDSAGTDVNKTVRKPAPAGVTFMLYAGSGYTDVDTEGTTFYALDALTGDVVHSKDIGDRAASTAGIPANLNAIVANPAAFAQNLLVPGTSIPNLANELTTRVYVGDVHGRLWRFYTDDPDFAKTLPSTPFADLGDGQAVTKGAGLLFYDTTGTAGNKPIVFVNAGGDKRISPTTARPFKGFGFAEESTGAATQLFTFDWPPTPAPGFRGTIQPTTAFTTGGLGRVFFVGTRLNPPGASCISTFDSLIAALGAGSGQAAYNMGTADDRFLPIVPGKVVTPVTTETGKPGVGTGDRIPADPPPPPAPQPKSTSGASVFPPPGPSGAPVFRTLSSVCK